MRRGAALALVAAVALGAAGAARAEAERAPAASDSKRIDALLEQCAKSPGLLASFVEEKQIALLAVPLKAEGTIHFAPGRGLVRHTTKPSRESVLVNDKEIVLWDGKSTKRVALGSSVTIETFARAFSLLLGANRAALEKDFRLSYTELSGGAYRLRLEPKGQDLAKVITAIEIEGRGLDLSMLRVREANGDVSTTRFSGVDAAKKYDAAELERVFRVPPG